MSILPKFTENTGYGVIGDVLARAKEGFASPNNYEVIITGPPRQQANSLDIRKISLSCEAVSMPAQALETSPDDNVYGVSREVVTRPSYAGDITMTFQTTSELEERVFFEEWQQLAFDPTTWNVGYYNDYIGVVDIYVLNRENKRRYGIRLHEAYPKEVQGVDLSYSTVGEALKINVTMQYRYWDTLDENRLQVSDLTPAERAQRASVADVQ